MPKSPIDDMSNREEIEARVVDPGPPLRVHGYDHLRDLAPHYGFAEFVLLALTGRPPSESDGKRFELALMFAAPVTVGDSGVHAASLARRYGSADAGVFTVAAAGLGEQARIELAQIEALLGYFDATGESPVPPAFEASDESKPEIEALLSALERHSLAAPLGIGGLSFAGVINAMMYECGLRRRCDFLAAWSLARLPLALAEANAVARGALADYPINLPTFSGDPVSR